MKKDSEIKMKFKFVALILALTVMSWAQTATQSNPPSADSSTAQTAAPADAKAGCSCCEKGATDAKDGASCCHHHAMSADNSKDMASCCGGKDAKSCCDGKDAKACMRTGSDKASAGCCSGAKCADKDGKAGCCTSDKKDATMAMACCGQHGHCPMHDGMHDHADMNK